MKRTMIKRVVAMFLAMCIVLTGITIPENTLAAQNDKEKQNNNQNAEQVKDSWMQEDSVIFKHLDKENFKNGKHISRLENEEKLNTYVFGNEDGSKTVYYMYENVKYKDKDGKIKDKDISLVKKNKGYGIIQNEVDLFLPENPSDGVTVNYSGYDVTIIPQGGNGKVKAKQCDDAIIYDEYFGKNASLKYTPLLSGVKEDIILKSYVENATYDFIVETNGLYIYNDDIGYYLADETNSTIIYYLGDVEVYDAIGKPELGEMKVTALEEGQRYKLTLSVSDTFLSDPETVFPVTIDPTITISDNTTGANSIIDAPIFEAKKNTNYAKYKYNSVGTTTASYGIGRTVVKLPGLTSSNEYQTIKADQITSVKFYVRDSSGTGKQTINLYPLTNTTWTETSVKWSNVGSHITDDNYSAILSSGKVTGFDITGLVKYWKTGKYSADAGFILINSTETKNKSFCSSEYGTTSYRPYVEMTYEEDFSLSTYSTEVAEGGTVTIDATTNPSGQTVTWKIVQGSATIVAYSNTSCTVKGVRAGDVRLEASITTTDGNKISRYCDIYVHLVDGVYYIKNMNSGYCLEVPGGTIKDYTKVEQAAQYSSTTSEVTRLRQMWKVRYMGNGSYSIRPLHNAEMGLYWGGNLMVWNIGTNDNIYSTPKNAQWTMSWDGSGYVVKQHSNNVTAVMQVSGASKSEGANIVTGANAANANCRWTFSKITNVPSGLVLYDTSTGLALSGGTVRAVAIDETKTLDDLRLKAVVYSGDFKTYGFTWHLQNLSYDEYVDIDSSTGEVVGLAEKSVTVTATSVLYNGPKSVSYTLKVIPFKNGTYFIKNKQFGKCLQIDDNDTPTYDTIDAIMEQWSFIGEEYQKWTLKSLNNGYYKIVSAKSDLVLSVKADQEKSVDEPLVQDVYTGEYRQQWSISQTANGSYKIKPRSSEELETDLVMAVGDSITAGADDTDIEQRLYKDNNSFMDEWVLIPLKEKAIIIVPGITCSSLQNENGTKVWLFAGLQSEIECNEYGESINSIYPYNPDNYGVLDYYKNIYNTLSKQYKDEYDVIFFAYDWRMSCAKAALELKKLTDYYNSCVLVAHSMGGVVSSSYLAQSSANREKVEKLITLGTPYTGAPKALYVIETGELMMGADALLQLSKYAMNIPAIYELLPTQRYFDRYNGFITCNGINQYTYNETWDYMKTLHWARKSDGQIKPMFEEAEQFQESLLVNGIYACDLPTVDTYKIYGTDEDTIMEVVFDETNEYSYYKYSKEGDGTVPIYSAINNAEKDSYKTYAFKQDHTGLITDEGCIQLVIDIINEEEYVYSEQRKSSSNAYSGRMDKKTDEETDRITIVVKNVESLRISKDEMVDIYALGEKLYYDDEEGTAQRVGSIWKLGENAYQYVLFNDSYKISEIVSCDEESLISIDYCNYGLSDTVKVYKNIDEEAVIYIADPVTVEGTANGIVIQEP